jgi:hypothetical protein
VKLSFLSGVRWRDWQRLRRENQIALRYWPRSIFQTLLSLRNESLAKLDDSVDLTEVQPEPPIFILGHWRSGTTHLQYLLAQDPSLGAPNNYQCCFPNSCLKSEALHGGQLARWVPARRLQDNMAQNLQTPGESEMALAALGAPTPYLAWAFPRRAEHYLRFLSLREATAAEREAWRRAMEHCVRKWTLIHRRPLILKSPANTARVRWLLELFPDARFVHIHRHPLKVYQSSLHLYRVWKSRIAFLQKPDFTDTEQQILRLYREMYEALQTDEDLIPRGNYHVMRFEELEQNPLGELNRLYHALNLGKPPVEPLKAYLADIQHYQKNNYPTLEPSVRERVEDAWGHWFRDWGYFPN